MPAVSYSDINTNVKPAPNWRFWLTFPNIPGAQQAGQRLPFLAQRVAGVQKSIEVEPIVFEAGVRHFPIGWSVDNLVIQLVEDLDATVSKAIRRWINMVIDNDNNFGIPGGPNGYKKDFSLQSLGPDGQPIVTFSWKSCMPLRLDSYEWDGTQTGMLLPQLTVSVDDIADPQ